MLLISIYLAKPQWVDDSDKIHKQGIDIVLSLDISWSMEADDIAPNRLSTAKQVLDGFIQKLETDRVGMLVFAGKPFVSVPLTFDQQIFLDILENTTTDTINQRIRWLQWTAIGDALLSSLQILEKWRNDYDATEDREQIIILLTDGTANTGVDPLVVAQLASEQGVKIYTVGIWSLEWWSIPYQTPFGIQRQAVEWVDEAMLSQVAEITQARYWRATDADTFERIFEEIARLEKHDIEIEEITSYKDTWERLIVLLWWILLLFRWYERYRPLYPK